MYLTGFADEAGADLDTQIKATEEIGWSHIESRKVALPGHEAANLHDISDAAFEDLVERLASTKIKINCFGSAIANWAKHINQPLDADASLAEAQRAIPRMQRLGTTLIRIMSYAVIKEHGPEDQLFEERVRRLNAIVPLFLMLVCNLCTKIV